MSMHRVIGSKMPFNFVLSIPCICNIKISECTLSAIITSAKRLPYLKRCRSLVSSIRSDDDSTMRFKLLSIIDAGNRVNSFQKSFVIGTGINPFMKGSLFHSPKLSFQKSKRPPWSTVDAEVGDPGERTDECINLKYTIKTVLNTEVLLVDWASNRRVQLYIS